MTWRPSNAVVWFGVLGGAAAWATQFVANLALTFARCDQVPPRFMPAVHGWEIGLSAAALGVGLAAVGVCLRLFLRTFRIDAVSMHERRGDGSPPPIGRLHFLAIIGLTVNFLALTIIVMTGVGAPLLPVCQQA